MEKMKKMNELRIQKAQQKKFKAKSIGQALAAPRKQASAQIESASVPFVFK